MARLACHGAASPCGRAAGAGVAPVAVAVNAAARVRCEGIGSSVAIGQSDVRLSVVVDVSFREHIGRDDMALAAGVGVLGRAVGEVEGVSTNLGLRRQRFSVHTKGWGASLVVLAAVAEDTARLPPWVAGFARFDPALQVRSVAHLAAIDVLEEPVAVIVWAIENHPVRGAVGVACQQGLRTVAETVSASGAGAAIGVAVVTTLRAVAHAVAAHRRTISTVAGAGIAILPGFAKEVSATAGAISTVGGAGNTALRRFTLAVSTGTRAGTAVLWTTSAVLGDKTASVAAALAAISAVRRARLASLGSIAGAVGTFGSRRTTGAVTFCDTKLHASRVPPLVATVLFLIANGLFASAILATVLLVGHATKVRSAGAVLEAERRALFIPSVLATIRVNGADIVFASTAIAPGATSLVAARCPHDALSPGGDAGAAVGCTACTVFCRGTDTVSALKAASPAAIVLAAGRTQEVPLSCAAIRVGSADTTLAGASSAPPLLRMSDTAISRANSAVSRTQLATLRCLTGAVPALGWAGSAIRRTDQTSLAHIAGTVPTGGRTSSAVPGTTVAILRGFTVTVSTNRWACAAVIRAGAAGFPGFAIAVPTLGRAGATVLGTRVTGFPHFAQVVGTNRRTGTAVTRAVAAAFTGFAICIPTSWGTDATVLRAGIARLGGPTSSIPTRLRASPAVLGTVAAGLFSRAQTVSAGQRAIAAVLGAGLARL